MYFALWERTYALKLQCDKLYVREENTNIFYGGIEETKVISIRRRNIYDAYNHMYAAYMVKLKRIPDCDHYSRIELLKDLSKVLDKSKDLALAKKTRDLEKRLRNEEDIEKIKLYILEYKID